MNIAVRLVLYIFFPNGYEFIWSFIKRKLYVCLGEYLCVCVCAHVATRIVNQFIRSYTYKLDAFMCVRRVAHYGLTTILQ